MVESIMYFGIGILLAAASVLVVVARVRGRSVRLTAHQLESAIPSSTVENQEQNDIPRAAFPGSIRALEVKVEQLQGENDSHLAELRKKDDAVNRLQIELSALRQQLCTTEKELALKTTAMQESERALSERESKLAKLMADLEERSGFEFAQEIAIIALKTQVQARATAKREVENALSDTESKLAKLIGELDDRSEAADTQRIEIATLKDQIKVLKEHLDGVNRELKAVEGSRDVERAELKTTTEELAQVHSELYNFKCR